MKIFKYTIVILVAFLVYEESSAQCTPGGFEIPPNAAVNFDFCSEAMFPIIEDDCFNTALENGEVPFPNSGGGGSTLTLTTGMQHCFILPFDGNYNFQTCFFNPDDVDTQISVFDGNGIVLASADDNCGPLGLGEFASYFGTAGETICIQLCEGMGSNQNLPTLNVFVSCPSGSITSDFQDDGLLVCSSELLFDELQQLTLDDGLITVEDLTGPGLPFPAEVVNTFTFNPGIMTTDELSGASVTICAVGDLGIWSEAYNIVDEMGNCVGGINQDLLGDCSGEVTCSSFNLSIDDLNAYLSDDGSVTFDVIDFFSNINDFCGNDPDETSLSLQLSICGTATPIPTLGQWGLIMMVISLLAVGLVYLRQTSLIIENK